MATRLVRRVIIAVGMLFLAIGLLFICNNTVNVKAESLPDNMAKITGVEVKYNEAGDTVSGLRFIGRINKSLIDGKTGIEYGMLFLPKQLYVNDAGMNYGNVGKDSVAKADCTGNIESDDTYYYIAVYLSGIGSANYNCDYYALIYIKDGSTCQYSASKHASIAQTAKYLLDNRLDEEHRSLLKDFILRYPVNVYGYNDALLDTIYVSYGDTVELPEGKGGVDGYYGYVFDKYVTASGGNIEFNDSEPILGTTNVYSKHGAKRAGVVLKDIDTGVGDCGSVNVVDENGSLVTVATSSGDAQGIVAFSDVIWTEYLTQQSANIRNITMDIKFGRSVSLSGYIQSGEELISLSTIRNKTQFFNFYSGNTPVAYSSLVTDTWYKLEIDIHAIKNFAGSQVTTSGRSSFVIARHSVGTISLKNVSFPEKYDTEGYKYSSISRFDDATFNTAEWYWKSASNTDGVGLYADKDTDGNGFLYFDGAAQGATFGTKQTHKNFELSFDIYDAKTDSSVAINGVNSAATDYLRISFGQNSIGGEAKSVDELTHPTQAESNAVNLFIYKSGSDTRVRFYDTGTYGNSTLVPAKYSFFGTGYSGERCRLKLRVENGVCSVYVKHVNEKEWTTLIASYAMKTPSMEGYVIFRGYGNQFDPNRTVHSSTHCKVDNIVLGDLTNSFSIPNTPNTVTPPAEYSYTPRNDDDLKYPYNSAS